MDYDQLTVASRNAASWLVASVCVDHTALTIPHNDVAEFWEVGIALSELHAQRGAYKSILSKKLLSGVALHTAPKHDAGFLEVERWRCENCSGDRVIKSLSVYVVD